MVMPEDVTDVSVSESEEMRADAATPMTSATDATAAADADMQQQLDSSLIDTGDEGPLQIVVEDPMTDDDQQQTETQHADNVVGGLDSVDTQDLCPPADDHVELHVDTACANTSTDELAAAPADVTTAEYQVSWYNRL